MPTASNTKTKPKPPAKRKTPAKKSTPGAPRRVKRGGSAASNAVMSNSRCTVYGGASDPVAADVAGRGAPVDVGTPALPMQAATDSFAASAHQQLVAAQPFHSMGYIDKGVVYPNVPVYNNPRVFGGCGFGWSCEDKKKCAMASKSKKSGGGGGASGKKTPKKSKSPASASASATPAPRRRAKKPAK